MTTTLTGKMSVLEIVQTVLEKMDSDEVNTIFETVESRGVATEVRDSFRHIVSNSEDYQTEGYIQLEGLADATFYNQLRLPDNVLNIHEFWMTDQNNRRIVLEYLPPKEFVDMLFNNEGARQVPAAGTIGPTFPVGNCRDPEYYTTFDEKHIFLDSVDLEVNDTVHAARTGARATIAAEFRLEDDFVPPLFADEFPLLLNEVIDASFINFKGVSNSKAQSRARQQKVMKQNNRDRIQTSEPKVRTPSYGRRTHSRAIRQSPGMRVRNS